MLHSSQNTPSSGMQAARQISRSSWLLLTALSMMLFGYGCSRSQQSEHNSTGSRAKTEVALPFSAEMWLKWDKSSRLAFIMGNLRGYWDGVEAGCFDAKRAVRSLPGVSGFTPEVADEMRIHCGTKYKPSNWTFESYEEVITHFYTRYPEDRIIEIQDVLLLLAPDSELTAEDIHKRIKITQTPKRWLDAGVGVKVRVKGGEINAEASIKGHGEVSLSGNLDVSAVKEAKITVGAAGEEYGVGKSKETVTVKDGKALAVHEEHTDTVWGWKVQGQKGSSSISGNKFSLFQISVCAILCVDVGVGIKK